MKIASVTRIRGPAQDGQFFVITRYEGLFGRLLGRRMWATVHWNGNHDQPAIFWGDSSDIVCDEVHHAVMRFVWREAREQERARLRGDAHWRRCALDTRGPRLLQERCDYLE